MEDLKIREILKDKKDCIIIYSNRAERTEISPDYLALESLTKENIAKYMQENADYIIPNVTALNVLENMDELRVDLNNILKSSKWANEACIIITDVDNEEVELLRRFSVHYNVSMILLTQEETIVLPRLSYSPIDAEFVISNLGDSEFNYSIVKLAKAIKLMNESYREIVETMEMILDF
jgi:hypothetical protein